MVQGDRDTSGNLPVGQVVPFDAEGTHARNPGGSTVGGLVDWDDPWGNGLTWVGLGQGVQSTMFENQILDGGKEHVLLDFEGLVEQDFGKTLARAQHEVEVCSLVGSDFELRWSENLDQQEADEEEPDGGATPGFDNCVGSLHLDWHSMKEWT